MARPLTFLGVRYERSDLTVRLPLTPSSLTPLLTYSPHHHEKVDRVAANPLKSRGERVP